MKTRVFSLLLLCLGSALGFAQGTIQVGNGITGSRFPIYAPEPGAPWGYQVVGNSSLSHPTGTTVYTGGLLSGTRYMIEFWAGPASATDFSGLTLITTTTFRTGADPLALPNGITSSTTGTIPGVLAGSQARLAVRVWDTDSGPNFSASYVRAQTPLFLSGPLSGTAPNGDQFIGAVWIGQSFSLPAIPEPSVSILVSGVVAAGFVLRRRK